MKFLFTYILALLFVSDAFSQEIYYRPGLIVTVTNDTIYCLVPLINAFGTAVPTKKTENDKKIDSIPVSRIRYLANGINVYETISFDTPTGTQQKLMWLEVEGKINLYQEFYFDKKGHSRSAAYSDVSFDNKPVRTCVLRKDNQTYLVSGKNFTDIVRPLVADNLEITAKLVSGAYNYENVTDFVKAYDAVE